MFRLLSPVVFQNKAFLSQDTFKKIHTADTFSRVPLPHTNEHIWQNLLFLRKSFELQMMVFYTSMREAQTQKRRKCSSLILEGV